MLTLKRDMIFREAIKRYGMSEDKFHFAADDGETRIIYKPQGFYFRLVASRPPVPASFLYVYSTPDRGALSIDHKREVYLIAEAWDDVESCFESWLDWISDEYESLEDSRSKAEKLSQQWDKIASSFLSMNETKNKIPSPLTHLHPIVQQVANSRFASGHYSDAVEKACIAVEKAVREKANQPDNIEGTDLMNRVFSKDSPLLTLSANRGEREGYMFLYRGMWQAIRNHYAHNDPALSSSRALEWLSFISALFYKLDEARPTATP